MAERTDRTPTGGAPTGRGGAADRTDDDDDAGAGASRGDHARGGDARGDDGAENAVRLSFEELYAARFTPMVQLATLLCGQVEVARDIVQDCFVELHVRWSDVDRPTAYLRRSVVNRCRSRARWERLRRGRRSDVEPAEDQPVDELGDVLARLPERQRAAVVLKYYDRRTEVEIAEILGCRPGSVGPLVTRALRTLRNDLAERPSATSRSVEGRSDDGRSGDGRSDDGRNAR